MTAMEQTVGQIIVDEHQMIVEVDDRYVEIVARPRSELIGRHALSFTFDKDLGRNRPLLDHLACSGPAFAITKRYISGDGAIFWVENHVSAVRSATGSRFICATTKPIDRPYSADALSRSHKAAHRLCATLIAGRAVFGSDIVSIPPAEILLLLYRAELEGAMLSLGDLAARIDVAVSSMVRWANHLHARQLIEIEVGADLRSTTIIRISRMCELALEGLLSGGADRKGPLRRR